MRVEKLSLRGFRNLQDGEFVPGKGVNVLYGDNAQGKTNLLEAVWLFTGAKSFRGAKDQELVKFDADKARLDLSFVSQNRGQEASLVIGPGRAATLGGIKQKSASALAGVFCAVVFAPSHLSLVREGPSGRRRFIDAAISQIRPRYISIISEYNRALAQRNTLLKDLPRHTELYDTLEIWEDTLASLGGQIYETRLRYVRRIASCAASIYAGLSGEKEQLHVGYDTSLGENIPDGRQYREAFRRQLRATRKEDLFLGHTSCGPHRDDLKLTINSREARNYGSQGQQRSCVLALKLAEASLLRDITGELPVALLDDVMSELDAGRQDYILNHIDGWQVFITCCDPAPVLRLSEGHTFSMKNGVYRADEEGG
ncbi:MAG: DNA replication/repair protein RecF [Clostridiales bacterium]|nr:DNA replication/repair protein RecF [Clostridiales bacterium]